MTLQSMISALLDSGMSQASIAEACGTNQPTIHRAVNGSDVRYSTGREIERLYRRLGKKRKAA